MRDRGSGSRLIEQMTVELSCYKRSGMSNSITVGNSRPMVKDGMRVPAPSQDDTSVRLKRSRVRVDGSDLTDSKGMVDSSSNNTGAGGGGNARKGGTVAPVENTYQLKPDWKFSSKVVEQLAEDILIKHLQDVEYEPVRCKQLSQELASIIMDGIKTLQIKRYKLIAVVSIGSIKERPGMQFGSRCLWNQDTDSFVSVKFTNGSLFAVAMVYGLYFE